MMQEQAKHIRELEQNLQEVRGGTGERGWRNDCHRVCSHNEPHQCRAQHYVDEQSYRGNDRPQKKEHMYSKEPQNQHSQRV